jgi:LmbE family N-acetylglucosaminyl deacetylase
MFTKATKSQKRLRLALTGPSGAGKTYSALSIASHLGKSIAVIDTERASASLYSDAFDFDSCSLTQHHHSKYIEAIRGAAEYDVLIIDSLTHAWYQSLEMAGGQFQNWAKVRPLERALIEAILDFPGHVIVTIRSKTEYVVTQKTNGQGRVSNSPEKVGTAPIQASGIEYEFDVTGDLNLEHILTISKTRCEALDQTTWLTPGKELADVLTAWLTDGAELPPMPESADQKKARLAASCKKLGLSAPDIKPLLAEYHAQRAADLTTEQLDEVISKLATVKTKKDDGDTETEDGIPF